MSDVGINQFVRRQTASSKYSHFDGSFEELADLVSANFANHKAGYRDGVVLVPVPADRFFSGVVKVDANVQLHASFEARSRKEEPYVQVTALGSKLPARTVDVVLYRKDVLGADAAGCEAEWQIISINASCVDGEEPMTPMAMARNFLGLAGGTKADYTAEQFAQAIVFWSTHAMVKG